MQRKFMCTSLIVSIIFISSTYAAEKEEKRGVNKKVTIGKATFWYRIEGSEEFQKSIEKQLSPELHRKNFTIPLSNGEKTVRINPEGKYTLIHDTEHLNTIEQEKKDIGTLLNIIPSLPIDIAEIIAKDKRSIEEKDNFYDYDRTFCKQTGWLELGKAFTLHSFGKENTLTVLYELLQKKVDRYKRQSREKNYFFKWNIL